MPWLFITDGGPEAEEYASSSVWYDPRDPASVQRALDETRRLRGDDAAAAPAGRAARSRVSDRRFLPSGWLPRVVRIADEV